MKQYAYYPGCSLESLATSYNLSTLEVAHKLRVDLKEIKDWNCCGATSYFPVDELLAHTLIARNLALAEKDGLSDFVAPCSACYKNAYFTNAYLKKDPDLAEHINYALEADNLHVNGTMKIRHLIEVFIEDVGLDEIEKKITSKTKIVSATQISNVLGTINDARLLGRMCEGEAALPPLRRAPRAGFNSPKA